MIPADISRPGTLRAVWCVSCDGNLFEGGKYLGAITSSAK